MDFIAPELYDSAELLSRTLLELLVVCVTVGTDDSKTLAAHLGVAPATIDSSFKRIHKHLGTNTRAQAILFALNHDWVKLPRREESA